MELATNSLQPDAALPCVPAFHPGEVDAHGVTGADGVSQFKAYFLDVYVARAYRELDGPLGGLPDLALHAHVRSPTIPQ
jgi:hypothetical protein